jgi:hypothetical protein
MICAMSDEEQPESFEDKLRAIARELSESVERAAERVDVEAIADQIALGGERVRELAESAGRWMQQMQEEGAGGSKQGGGGGAAGKRLSGPHPLDIPTEEQALALSALSSGRWRVAPGTNEVVAEGEDPAPDAPLGTVSELRARDWIAASGEVTPLGAEALKRWSDAATGGS